MTDTTSPHAPPLTRLEGAGVPLLLDAEGPSWAAIELVPEPGEGKAEVTSTPCCEPGGGPC